MNHLEEREGVEKIDIKRRPCRRSNDLKRKDKSTKRCLRRRPQSHIGEWVSGSDSDSQPERSYLFNSDYSSFYVSEPNNPGGSCGLKNSEDSLGFVVALMSPFYVNILFSACCCRWRLPVFEGWGGCFSVLQVYFVKLQLLCRYLNKAFVLFKVIYFYKANILILGRYQLHLCINMTQELLKTSKMHTIKLLQMKKKSDQQNNCSKQQQP